MNDLEAPTPDSKRGTHLMAILVLCYLVSFAGVEGAMRGLGDWYPSLAKPAWAPPMVLFVPLWTLVYGALSVAVWQVWEARDRPARLRSLAIAQIVPQAILGGLWPWLFFSYHLMLVSAIEGCAAWVLACLSLWAFARVRTSAALILLPYWIWGSVLTLLAFALWRTTR